jgi:hypothetical protein
VRETGSSGGENVGGASSEIRRVVVSAVGRLEVNVLLLVLLVAVGVVAIAAAGGMEGLEGRNKLRATQCNTRHQLQPAPD